MQVVAARAVEVNYFTFGIIRAGHNEVALRDPNITSKQRVYQSVHGERQRFIITAITIAVYTLYFVVMETLLIVTMINKLLKKTV